MSRRFSMLLTFMSFVFTLTPLVIAFKIFNFKKTVNEKHNWLERTAVNASEIAQGTSHLIQSSIFILAGLVNIGKYVRHYFMSPEAAANEVGLMQKMLVAEAGAQAAMNRLANITWPPTHGSTLLRFIGHNYYTLLVLFVFLNICLVVWLFHLKFNSAAASSTTSTSAGSAAEVTRRKTRRRRRKSKRKKARLPD